MSINTIVKFILTHPLNKYRKYNAIKNYISWQIGSRLVPGPVAIDFVNQAKLLVYPGMNGATGNLYAGLHEFEDMSFLLHVLRPEDLFMDIGANIGSYTILASAVVGAQSLSCEPLPKAYRHFVNNIRINDITNLVQAHNVGIGKEDGVLHFTDELDTVNHVANDNEIKLGSTREVKVQTLDSFSDHQNPMLIKIDVEGFETNIIAGGKQIFSNPDINAVIMELNGSGARYGFDENILHKQMLNYGFNTYTYSPLDRKLISLEDNKSLSGNTLYIKNLDRVIERLTSAPKFRVLDYDI